MAVIVGGNGDDTLIGADEDDLIEGLGGNDILIGGGGDDTTDGGTGDDRHHVESAGDIVIELSGQGDDRIIASVSYLLAAGVEVETMTTANAGGTEAIDLTGNEVGQSLYGNAGNNILDGGGGADFMVGLAGNDTYVVDDAGDVVAENPAEGDDLILAGVSFRLGAGAWVETIATADAAGLDSINLTGNEIAQSVYGNAGINVLDGGAGDDLLAGAEGDDVLIGGAGLDALLGGRGNDSYYVDNANDLVLENPGEGEDSVYASVNYTLRPGISVEAMVVSGAAGLTLLGNELANSLYGNIGNDILIGGSGDDFLVGGDGNDTLEGENGTDVMRGGAGNDVYIVRNSFPLPLPPDRVFEAVGEGNDTIRLSGVSFFQLEAGQEIETLDGTTASSDTLIGNEFNNTIIGSSLANSLHDGGGVDILTGAAGNDRYYVSNSAAQVVELTSGGTDTVFTSVSYTLAAGTQVETLSTYWQFGNEAIDLTGNEIANRLIGNFAANRLDGKAGNDVLDGKGGSDTLAFTTALGTTNVDTILEFQSGIDRIALDNAIFTALAEGSLPAGAFAIGSAQDADDRIIYDPGTGALLYDADGAGGSSAVQFAILDNKPAIQASDFIVI